MNFQIQSWPTPQIFVAAKKPPILVLPVFNAAIALQSMAVSVTQTRSVADNTPTAAIALQSMAVSVTQENSVADSFNAPIALQSMAVSVTQIDNVSGSFNSAIGLQSMAIAVTQTTTGADNTPTAAISLTSMVV